jgi:hypothetical protein
MLLSGTLNVRARGFLILVAMLAASCSSTKLLPGAEQVKITRIRADVAQCRELGTVVMTTFSDSNVVTDQLRNQTVKLGGNTIFVLDDRVFTPSGAPESGMAYRCP